MIGIVIDHDVVTVPKPVGRIGQVECRNPKKERAECESIAVSAMNTLNMMGADVSGEVSVLPVMIEMVMGVIAAGVMPDPGIRVAVHVRRDGVARPVRCARWPMILGRSVRLGKAHGRPGRRNSRGPVCGDMAAADTMLWFASGSCAHRSGR